MDDAADQQYSDKFRHILSSDMGSRVGCHYSVFWRTCIDRKPARHAVGLVALLAGEA